MTDAPPQMITFTVNGQEVQAAPGRMLIDACEDAGVYIPRFCYHPRMSAVGMCRMCLVEVDTGRGPALQPSCMLTVGDGMVVDTESDVTKKAQDGVLEFLLINHPLDCPVCDKGGECPLQDQTMAYGPGETRFIEEKRHFEKPIPINENVYLDRERCILCDRCTRFAKEVAGDPLIHFQDRGNQTQVNTFPDEPFASYFSGNVVQICPVGALTAKPYRFKARPWDLDETDSTYPNPMGDRINVQASRNQVLRIQGVDSDATNWGWMSDKERFSFNALQSEARVSEPLVRGGGLNQPDPDGTELVAASWPQALSLAANALKGDPKAIGFIGGARLNNEAQYAWTKLAKGILGTDNVDAQLDDGLPADVVLSLPRATVAEACQPGGTIILMAPDPKEEAGTLFLRLRHAVTTDGAKLIELTPAATGLSSLASVKLHARPGELGHVAEALAGTALGDAGGVAGADIEAARALIADGPVTVVYGRTSLAESDAATLSALSSLTAISGATFLPLLRRGNVMGAIDMGMTPGTLPGRNSLDGSRSSFGSVWPSVAPANGMGAREMLQAAADGKLDTLVLLGADPIQDFPDADLARKALSTVKNLVAVDLFVTASAQLAHVVLPAAAFTETSGSHTNLEGRVTAINQKVTPPGTARDDWTIAAELALSLGEDLGFDTADDIWAELGGLAPVYADVNADSIRAHRDGVLVTGSGTVPVPPAPAAVPAQPTGNSALRLVLSRRMFDNGTMVQQAEALAGLAGPTQLRLHPTEVAKLGIVDGDPIGLTNSNGSAQMVLAVDNGVPRGVAVVDYNRSGDDVRSLVANDDPFTDVKLETVSGGAS